jgi:hypothetical protein
MDQTPEQLQFISNIGHTIEGVLFAIVALIALLQALGYMNRNGAQYMWPSLIVIAGIFLPAYILLQRGFDQIGVSWNVIIHDPQQRQHIFMAILLVIAGAAELAVRSKTVEERPWKFVPPGALLVIGITLLCHTQYGTPEAVAESMRKHHYQGISVILVGLFRVVDIRWRRRNKWLAYPWIVFLFVAAALLITYREPWGAYRDGQWIAPLNAKAVFWRGTSVRAGSVNHESLPGNDLKGSYHESKSECDYLFHDQRCGNNNREYPATT